MKTARQTTIRDAVQLDGIGVHTGAAVSVTLHPAEAGAGISFLRSDQDEAEIPAVFRNVSSAARRTEAAASLSPDCYQILQTFNLPGCDPPG